MVDNIRKTTGRVLAVDFGDTRTGLAVSDSGRFLASGLGYVSPGGIVKTADAVAVRARELGVSAVVVGLPVNMNGTEGPRCEFVKEFCSEIQKIEPEAKIIFWDERLSTVAATRSLIEADMSRKKRKKVVDKMAAVFILQGWLDSHPQL